ncbi:MAG TPA: CBS domain-containing protein [Chitinophagaceae bacterium]|nr:CBS domain-containing protein [Chitinophagaceae bacterium]
MLNKQLISSSLPVLSLQDSIFQAQQLMTDYHLIHLPVTDHETYIGLISEDDAMNAADDSQSLGQLENQFLRLSVRADAHFLEAVQLCNSYGLSVVPVVEKEMEWVGAIQAADLLKYLGRMTGTDEPGGIIVLELEKANFSFSEISKLVETNDAQITQLNSFYDNQVQLLYVTIKLNRFEVSDIVATFQRYEYTVKYYFGEELYENEIRTNYDHLMNYLNM